MDFVVTVGASGLRLFVDPEFWPSVLVGMLSNSSAIKERVDVVDGVDADVCVVDAAGLAEVADVLFTAPESLGLVLVAVVVVGFPVVLSVVDFTVIKLVVVVTGSVTVVLAKVRVVVAAVTAGDLVDVVVGERRLRRVNSTRSTVSTKPPPLDLTLPTKFTISVSSTEHAKRGPGSCS